MKEKEKEERLKKQVGVNFTSEDHEELRIMAFEEDKQIAPLIRDIVKKEIEKRKRVRIKK